MKTITSSQSYQCDSCKNTPVVSADLPSGWKSMSVRIKPAHGKASLQELDFCTGCSQPGHAATVALLSKLLG